MPADDDSIDIEAILHQMGGQYDDCLERDPTWIIDGRGVSDCHAYLTARLISSDGFEALIHLSVHELLSVRNSSMSDKPRKSIQREFVQITLDEKLPRFQIPTSKIESILSRLLCGESQAYIAVEEEVNRRTVSRIDQINRDEDWNFVFPGDKARVEDWRSRTNEVVGASRDVPCESEHHPGKAERAAHSDDTMSRPELPEQQPNGSPPEGRVQSGSHAVHQTPYPVPHGERDAASGGGLPAGSEVPLGLPPRNGTVLQHGRDDVEGLPLFEDD